jgi:hypothetical protein
LKIYSTTIIEIIYCSGVTQRLEIQTLSTLVADGNGVIVVLYVLEMNKTVIGSYYGGVKGRCEIIL